MTVDHKEVRALVDPLRNGQADAALAQDAEWNDAIHAAMPVLLALRDLLRKEDA